MAAIGRKRQLLAWLWPERCAFCNKVIEAGTERCETCAVAVVPQTLPLCHACGKSKTACVCHGHKTAADGVAALYAYEGVIQRTVSYMKRGITPEQATYLGQQLADFVRQEFPAIPWDAVTFVPRIRSEERRGVHVSRRLAEAVARQLDLPCEAPLVKVRKTRMQKELTARERGGNLRGAFDVAATAAVKDRTFLLVDDVCTTGATIGECALMLKIYGAEAVYAVTLAGTVLTEKGVGRV